MVRKREMMKGSFIKFILPFQTEHRAPVTYTDLSDMKREAGRHNQLMLLYSQIMRQRERIEPRSAVDDFVDELKAAYYGNVARSARREVFESKTVDLLSVEDIPSILLRGSSIARDIYLDPYCRTSADVDLLIRQGDLMRADALLSEKGYVRCDGLPLRFWVSRTHHAVYHYPATNDLIEVHWNFGMPSFFRLTSADIWADAVPIGKKRYRLSPEMTLIHLLMHHHMHAFRELKILTDIIWAFHRYEDSIEWSTFGQRIEHIGLLKTAMITMGQVYTLCGERVASEGSLRKFKEAIQSAGHREPALLNRYFRMTPEEEYVFQDQRDKFMARLALDEWKKILRSFVTALFPLPEDLKELYRDKRSRMLPLHYSRFVAWRVKQWRG